MKMNQRTILQLAFFVALVLVRAAGQTAGSTVYLDPSQPIDVRVDDLVGQMTLEEKASQLVN